jgi:Helix-turn-helix domain
MGPEAALNAHGHLNVPASGRALNRWDFRQSSGRSKVPSRTESIGVPLRGPGAVGQSACPQEHLRVACRGFATRSYGPVSREEADAAGGKACEEYGRYKTLVSDAETFSSTVDAVRVELAATRYLTTTDRPLAEVADLLGFSGLSALSRWFSGRFDCSASAWRAAHRGRMIPAR